MEYHCNTSGDEQFEDPVDLEEEDDDDTVDIWGTFGIAPHVVNGNQSIPLQDHMMSPHPHHHPHSHPHGLVEHQTMIPFEEDPRLEPFLGMIFDSGDAAKTFYIAYAGRVGFSVRIARSRRSKCNETVIMLRFVCSREGFSREKRVTEGKKTRKRAASIREGCEAMLEVVRRGDEKWTITKLIKDHNHEVGLPSKVHYIATEGTEFEPFLGMEFESFEFAKTFYYSYASRVGFEARVRQSRRSLHNESLKMLKLVCSKHRYHSGKDNSDDGKQGLFQDPLRDGCEALFEVIRNDDDRWVVSKLVLEHSHELTPSPESKVRCIRSQGEVLVIAKNFSDTRSLLLNGQESRNYPKEVRYNDLGPEDAEYLLEYFKKTQAENPAFFYAVQVESNDVMTNIFWADAKARMAYNHFGDAVTFNTSYKKNKDLMPLVMFTGVNHHLQPIVFGCAFLVDESEASFVWLFENWLSAMCGRHPVSLVTDLDMAKMTAVAKVFPNTRHTFCKKHILATIQVELPGLFSAHVPFEDEITRCVDDSETTESFESCWDIIVDKYELRGNTYLQYLYNIRYQWVPVFLKDTFFAESCAFQKSENLDKVIGKYFTTKISLQVSVRQLGQALANNFEKEARADHVTIFNKPVLRTASPMEKQAAGVYTRAIFDRFQEEFVESFGYHVDKIVDGAITKYQVARSEEAHAPLFVTFDASENKAHCSCCTFESSGILCRHVLRVFVVVGIRTLPKDYILKRWTMNAKGVAVSDDYGAELRGNSEEPSTARYNDLFRDGVKCAREGATSVESYKVAKEALQKAIAEVVSAKQKRGQLSLENFIRSQKKNKKIGDVTENNDDSRKIGKKMTAKMSPPGEIIL